MNNILLIEPYDILLDKYRNNNNVAIYSDKVIRCWEKDKKNQTSINISYPSEINKGIDVETAKSKVEWWMPIWFRWIGEVDDYEIYRKSCLLYIINLSQTLIKINIKNAIFFTSVSHHIEYSFIEVACQIAGIKQIYLYSTSFGSNAKLLPLVQHQSIQDRKVLGFDISQNSALAEIIKYRDNFLSNKPPIHNEKVDVMGRSYYYAALQIFKISMKKIIKKVLRYKVDKVKHFIDRRFDYNSRSLLKIISKQNNSLAYYQSKIVDNSYVDKLITDEGTLPIIFAHYQPEATTFPEGGDYSNHVDVVIKIRQMGYRGVILYKEHPASWLYYSKITGVSRVGLYRSQEYYKQLEALGCIFLKTSFRLTERYINNLLPVTITGSIGLERSVIGLSTCCAGEPWYKGVPGVCSIYDAFKEDGVFYKPQCWQFDGDLSVKWLDENISYRAINNYVGIGSGITSSSEVDKNEFLIEFNNMVEKLR